jgi:hypothetical protein
MAGSPAKGKFRAKDGRREAREFLIGLIRFVEFEGSQALCLPVILIFLFLLKTPLFLPPSLQ